MGCLWHLKWHQLLTTTGYQRLQYIMTILIAGSRVTFYINQKIFSRQSNSQSFTDQPTKPHPQLKYMSKQWQFRELSWCSRKYLILELPSIQWAD